MQSSKKPELVTPSKSDGKIEDHQSKQSQKSEDKTNPTNKTESTASIRGSFTEVKKNKQADDSAKLQS